MIQPGFGSLCSVRRLQCSYWKNRGEYQMKVYRGDNGLHWIEPRIVLQLDLEEVIDGLCSRFIRNRCEEDGPLPDSMTREEILEIVRREYRYYGTNAAWTWTESPQQDVKTSREWARRLIIAVFPEMES
jgi:hypothetical protein